MQVESKDHKFYRGMQVLGVITIMAITLSLIAVLLTSFQQTKTVTDRKRTWHAVICHIEKALLLQPHLSPKTVAAEIKFYDSILVRDVHTLPCEP